MINATLTVAISGIHLGENCQPGPGAARALREALGPQIRLVGLGYDVWDSGFHSAGDFDDAFLMPYPSVGPTEYLSRLREVHASVPLDAMIPCLDVELPVLQCLSQELLDLGIRVVLPTRSALRRRAKNNLPELARSSSFKVPETISTLDPAEVNRAVERLGLPVVVKGPHYEAEVVHSLAAAQTAFARLFRAWGGPILFQQFVIGEEYNVAIVRDARSAHCHSVTMRKTQVTRQGKAWAGVTVCDDEIRAFSENVAGAVGWHGAAEVELLQDNRGELFLIEFNPRLPAWSYLTKAAGVNLPLSLLGLAFGDSLTPAPLARSGIYYVRHATEFVGEIENIATVVSTGRKAQVALPARRPDVDVKRQRELMPPVELS